VEDLSRWCSTALDVIDQALGDDPFWAPRFDTTRLRESPIGVHLAVLVEPFLGYILDGTKTIESRFAVRRFAPYGHVTPGDIVFLKAASGPVVGVCVVEQTWYFELDVQRIAAIRKRFGKAMRADTTEFWTRRKDATFASLMKIREVRELPVPLTCPKKDRRGWVVLRPGQIAAESPEQRA
jgi:hypothetical protein